MYELESADAQNVAATKPEGRYNDLDEANAEMWRRKGSEPRRAFFLFLRLSPFCRILSGHTL